MGKNSRGHFIWKCLCECGAAINRHGSAIKAILVNCGCHKRKNKPYQWAINKLGKPAGRRTKYIECTLTPEEYGEIAKQKYCTYCHKDLTWRKYGSGAYNLDRMNNDIGYTKENCTPCCARCNRGKSNEFTYEEWFAMTEPFRNGKLIRLDIY